MSKLQNQFYKDNAPNHDEFKVLGALFDSLTGAFDEIITQSIDNSKISTMRTFTTIPMQTINVVDACYSLPTILASKEVLNILGIDPIHNMQERISIWNGLSPKVKSSALDQIGLVLMLVNPNTLRGGDDYGDTFKVVDFEMYDQLTGDKLIFGLDYYYEYNKIYFLRFGAQTNKYNNKKVILKNIVIDNNNPEKVLGESLGIYANSNFSPTEYRDVITSFASAALAGPVISRINESFNPDANLLKQTKAYSGFDTENALKGVTVIDYKSADPIRKRFWDLEVDGTRKLNGFDFLVVTPLDYLYRTEKIEYVQEFVKMIKPAQSSFVICPEFMLKDVISMRYSKFSFDMSGEMKEIIERLTYSEEFKLPTKHITKDEIPYRDETLKIPAHITEDFLDISNMENSLWYSPIYNPLDNIPYKDNENMKFGQLACIDRVHTRRHTFHVADDVMLDTDYFDCLLLTDYFNTVVSHEMNDTIPPMKTGGFKLTWVKYIHDNLRYSDSVRKMINLSTYDKMRCGISINGEKSLETDIGDMYDSFRMYDNILSKKTSSAIKDTLIIKNKDRIFDISRYLTLKENIRSIENIAERAIWSCNDSIGVNEVDVITSPYLTHLEVFPIRNKDSQIGLLNTNILYDKISNREEKEISASQIQADKIKFSSASNIAICDSFVRCDYDEATSFRLDIVGLPDDEEANVYEVVAIKLIPKEG